MDINSEGREYNDNDGPYVWASEAAKLEVENDRLRGENAASFTAGARAVFDRMIIRVVNHWHGNPEVNKSCQAENAVITEWATDALEDVSPESCATWRNIDVMAAQIRELEAENARLTALLEPKDTALSRFTDADGFTEDDPMERLRFFCSLAMNGQDWLDVEPFIDAETALLDPQSLLRAALSEGYGYAVCGDKGAIAITVSWEDADLIGDAYGIPVMKIEDILKERP
jgi:hypothetical protein